MHLGPEVLGQVAVDAELDHALVALEGSRVGRGGGAERLVLAHFVPVQGGALVLRQVTLENNY